MLLLPQVSPQHLKKSAKTDESDKSETDAKSTKFGKTHKSAESDKSGKEKLSLDCMLNDTGEQDQDNVIPTEKTTTNVDKSSISNYERQTGRQRERQILTFGSTDIQERHIVRPRSCASRSSPTTTRSPLNDKKSSGQKTQGPRGMLPGTMRLKEKKIDNQRRSMMTWMSSAVAKPRDQALQIQPDPLLLAEQDPKNCKQNE